MEQAETITTVGRAVCLQKEHISNFHYITGKFYGFKRVVVTGLGPPPLGKLLPITGVWKMV